MLEGEGNLKIDLTLSKNLNRRVRSEEERQITWFSSPCCSAGLKSVLEVTLLRKKVYER